MKPDKWTRRRARQKFMHRWAQANRVRGFKGWHYGSAYFYARVVWDRARAREDVA